MLEHEFENLIFNVMVAPGIRKACNSGTLRGKRWCCLAAALSVRCHTPIMARKSCIAFPIGWLRCPPIHPQNE
jgi:hypothetical protein